MNSNSSAKIHAHPLTATVAQVDDYHGTPVPDPYRWLEDDYAPDTKAWVEAQNKVTFAYLERIPARSWIKERMTKLWNYERYGIPFKDGGRYFFSKNDGLQDQYVLYIQKGLDGAAEVLIDPNKWEGGGTTRLGAFAVSADAKYAVYGISKSGSDWQQYKVMELATKKTLPDTLDWVKVSGVAWHGDGFYYSRYPEPGKGKSEKAAINEDHRVYFHKVGTQQSQDRQVYQDADNPQRFNIVETTDDERFALLTVSDRGKGKDGNALFARDLSRGQREFNPVVKTIGNESYGVVDNVGESLLVETNKNAPNGRVVLVDPRKPDEANWKVILPEKPEPLEGVTTAGGKIFATYLKDVTERAYVYSLDGTLENEVELPGPGTVGGFGGNKDDTFVFYTFNSLNIPPTIYRYDIATKKSTIFRQPKVPGYDPDAFETRAVFYPSKDGTKIPMFLVHKKGLKLDGTNPTLLYGYGGFEESMLPFYSGAFGSEWYAQGGIFVLANIRGGGEFGPRWHQAAIKANKQKSYDDFIAVAEDLIARKFTTARHLGIEGGSNGGLLVGAVMLQRPELFNAVVCQAPLLDMKRYSKLLAGASWMGEYGDPDVAADWAVISRYSPYQNLKPGRKYPSILFTTSTRDDRVHPGHARKMAAAMLARGDDVLYYENIEGGHAGAVDNEQRAYVGALAFTYLRRQLAR
jgi:prolyl oligopeptidase